MVNTKMRDWYRLPDEDGYTQVWERQMPAGKIIRRYTHGREYDEVASEDPDLHYRVHNLLKRTAVEVKKPDGQPYVPSRAWRDLYKYGARRAVEKSIYQSGGGFGVLAKAGRVDLSYEWLVLNPLLDEEFSLSARRLAFLRIATVLRGAMA